MKKTLQFLLVFSVLMMGFTYDANAQRKKRNKRDVDEYFDDRGSFKDRLWYGGGFNIGGGVGGNFSSFQFGVSPMVGYKITDFFSFGPRVSIDFNYLKGNTITLAGLNQGVAIDGGRQASWITSVSGGLFARAKVLETIFLHGEVGYQSSKFAAAQSVGNQAFLVYDEDTDKLVTVNDNRNTALLGVGYNSSVGGGLGYEILVLYDFLVSEEEDALPFDFRIVFTYRF
ncbi:MAG: autotransporter domain-containing protein [Bacteroidota bacterium]